jgi:enamine deaminase RidA (YjgF/YER057c/UK114 family)
MPGDAAPHALLPVPLPGTQARLARGMATDRWVFATGQCGTDYLHGLAPDVVQVSHPWNGPPTAQRESVRLFANVAEVLRAGGSSLDQVVRIDQYYTGPEAVDPYHRVRRAVFGGRIPPSTSNLHRRFARTGQSIEVQVMAARPRAGFTAEHATFAPSYKIHHSSGYSPALGAGDFRFIPGQTAEARREEDWPVDPLARRPPGLWKGTPIRLETEFIVRHKLLPALQASGSSLENVVKAQVYLRDLADVPEFNDVWHGFFKVPPATTIIPTATPGFIMPELRIELNTIALADDGATRREMVAGDTLFDGGVAAIRAGDMLFLSGLMAVEHGALVAGARPDPSQPFFAMPAKAELRAILRQAATTCARAGTSLSNIVRIQQFHTNLADLPAAIEQWHEALEGAPLPLSAIEVPWLPVPGAGVLVDLWVHVPPSPILGEQTA